MTPYAALEVVETSSRREGRRWWVRDEEESHFFVLVEYVGNPGRLTCYCPDGEEPEECAHLRAVVELRVAAQAAAGPPLGVLKPSMFVD